MEDDSRSDSGVSTLRSDGARSSGDERSGSRSSALSDDRWDTGTALTALPTALHCCRSGSRPSASASVEPDIKIVGTVAGSRDPLQRSAAGPELPISVRRLRISNSRSQARPQLGDDDGCCIVRCTQPALEV